MASVETSLHGRLYATVTRWVAVDSIALERRLWSVVLLALVADLHTTALGLQQGLTEGNPAMRWAIDAGGIGALAFVKGTVVALGLGVRRRWPQYRLAVPAGLAVPWVAVVAVNLGVLR